MRQGTNYSNFSSVFYAMLPVMESLSYAVWNTIDAYTPHTKWVECGNGTHFDMCGYWIAWNRNGISFIPLLWLQLSSVCIGNDPFAILCTWKEFFLLFIGNRNAYCLILLSFFFCAFLSLYLWWFHIARIQFFSSSFFCWTNVWIAHINCAHDFTNPYSF